MKKSIPLSVTVAEQPSSPASKTSFLFNGQTWVMGVLNATPDSFYAASRAAPLESALRLAQDMITQGVDVIDVGGESTRPGAAEIPAALELERVLPVIDALRARWPDAVLSIDTQKSEVARQALAHGVNLVNDVSAFSFDPEMASVVAEAGAPVVLMHKQGSPQTMQAQPHYANVIDEIKKFFEERLAFATRHNIQEDRVVLDPGIGFGKTLDHNMTILKHLSEFLSLGRPLLVGVSRKSFIGKLLGAESSALPPEDRLEGSLASALWVVSQGAQGLRVHDVGATRRALQVWEAIQAV